MKINPENISEEYLKNLKTNISDQLDNLKTKEFSPYKLEDFYEMNKEDINKLLVSYNVENSLDKAIKIINFIKTENSFKQIFFLFKETTEKQNSQVEDIISELNKQILLEKEKNDITIEELENQIQFLDEIIVLFEKKITSSDVEKVKLLIINSDLDDEVKFKLSYNLSKILIEKILLGTREKSTFFEAKVSDSNLEQQSQKPQLESFSPEINTNDSPTQTEEKSGVEIYNVEVINSWIEKYKKLFSEYGSIGLDDIDEYISDDKMLKELLEANEIKKENLFEVIISILAKLKTTNDEKKIELYMMDLEVVDKKYSHINGEDYLKSISELGEKVNYLLSVLKDRFKNVTSIKDDYSTVLSEKQDILFQFEKIINENYLTQKRINEIVSEIQKIEAFLLGKRENTEELVEKKDLVELKSFVLFNYQESGREIKPYILDDLNTASKDNFIDKVLTSKELATGFQDFNILIEDLLLLGNPRYIDSENSSVSTNSHKIINRIYYENNNKHYTGMVRIRPKTSSTLRFVIQEVTFKANTRALEQIIDIFYKHLPNIKIDSDKNFKVNLNIVSGLKKSDKELYDEAISRRDNKKNLFIIKFIDKFNNNEELTKEECELFEQMLILSLNAFYELSQNNDKLNFGVIDKIGGMTPYGR